MTDNPCFYHLQFEELPRGSPQGERGALRTIYFRLSEETEGKMMFTEDLYYTRFSKHVTLLNPVITSILGIKGLEVKRIRKATQ